MGKRRKHGGRIRMLLMAVLAVIFVVSVGGWLITRQRAAAEKQFYTEMARQYTQTAAPSAQGVENTPPISVDFDALRAANKDVAGWIYCAGTELDYPVMHGSSNDDYLRRDFEGKSSTAGSIFIEALNQPDFSDANTILYGHHMADGSMFAALRNWQEQAFFDTHSVIWLLTPEKNYQILPFSAYATTADSGTYSIFTGPCEPLNDYLAAALEQASARSGAIPEGAVGYVVLSTCASAYGNDLERDVLHGALVPIL